MTSGAAVVVLAACSGLTACGNVVVDGVPSTGGHFVVTMPDGYDGLRVRDLVLTP